MFKHLKMAMKLGFNQKQKILSVTVTGYLTIEDIETSMLKVFSSDEYPHDVNTLWDIRKLSFDNIDIAMIKRIVSLRKKYNGIRGNARIAILSNYSLAAPIVKLYMILSKGLSQETMAFTSVEEAELWLCNYL